MSAQVKTEQAGLVELITVTIDGTEVQVPKGTLAIRAAEMIGVAIPRFCDHPLLDPVGACRQCLVEVPDAGNGRGFPKPQASCTLECAPGMQIKTQQTSEAADKAQHGIMELLLINHPLDCPICDKGGECPLQNQAMSNGGGETRYQGVKRTYPKPVNLSAQILLDRERCILCARCTRFSEQISGDPLIALVERGALQQVGRYAEDPYNSYFSGNVVQICPVGALTSAAYRFQSRPFDLVSTDVTCEHCAAGCQLRSDHRHFQVKRRLAGAAPQINEEWNCDKGRFAFVSARGADRITRPMIREDGELRVASWPEAIDAAVAGLKAAGNKVGVLTGGRLTLEDAYGYSKFARAVLGTNSIDFRSRPYGEDEARFLAATVAGKSFGEGVSYADLEAAQRVVLIAFEPEDESPAIFLRLRKAVRKNRLAVTTLAPFASEGTRKLKAELIPTAPGFELSALAQLGLESGDVVLLGERASLVPGLTAAVVTAAQDAAAKLAWIPRRAGDRGAIEAGCLPGLLPGGRPSADAAARADVAAAWEVPGLPAEAGLEADAILAAAATGELNALVVAGVEPCDFADAAEVREGLESVGFVVSLESRTSEVTERADVVFPVALIEEHSGTFLNWEHRPGAVNLVIKQPNAPMSDLRVLAALADALGRPMGVRTPSQARAELSELGTWSGPVPRLAKSVPPPQAEPVEPRIADGEVTVRLATWRELLDGGRGQDGEPALAATARQPVVRLSPMLATALGVQDGMAVAISSEYGWFTLPAAVTESMVAGTAWVPTYAPETPLGELALGYGAEVTLSLGGEE